MLSLKPEAGKIVYLDGLRGFAALIVVFTHFARAFYPDLFVLNDSQSSGFVWSFVSQTPVMVFCSGGFAVCTFFCLSGYVLSNRFFRDGDRLKVADSAVHRYFRLTIPILFASIISYTLLSLHLIRNQETAQFTGSFWLYKYLHVDPVFHGMLREGLFDVYFHRSNVYNQVLWTMGIEFLGSYLVYATLLFFGKHKVRFAVYAVLLAVFCQTYYSGFVLGMFLSDLSASGRLSRLSGNRYIVYPLAAFGIVLGSCSPYIYSLVGVHSEHSVLYIVYPMIGAFCFFLALLCSGGMKRFFSIGPMKFLGKVSFPLYLTHFLLIYSLTCIIFNYMIAYLPYNASAFAAMALSLPVMFGLSYLMYLYVDMNSIRFSRAFSRKVIEVGIPVVRRIFPGTAGPAA